MNSASVTVDISAALAGRRYVSIHQPGCEPMLPAEFARKIKPCRVIIDGEEIAPDPGPGELGASFERIAAVDLFGHPLTPQKQPTAGYTKHERRGRPNGYAATPGLGPAGERCKTCAHLCRTGSDGRFLKCGLMRAVWTRGNATDIRAKTPACSLWSAQAPAV